LGGLLVLFEFFEFFKTVFFRNWRASRSQFLF
jgi:hypothetical protein